MFKNNKYLLLLHFIYSPTPPTVCFFSSFFFYPNKKFPPLYQYNITRNFVIYSPNFTFSFSNYSFVTSLTYRYLSSYEYNAYLITFNSPLLWINIWILFIVYRQFKYYNMYNVRVILISKYPISIFSYLKEYSWVILSIFFY